MEQENTSKEIKQSWQKKFNKVRNDLDKIDALTTSYLREFDGLFTDSEVYDVHLHQLTDSLYHSVRGAKYLAGQISYYIHNERFIGEE